MLTLTESAGAHLSQMLTEAEAPDDVAVRIAIDSNQLVMQLTKYSEDDASLEHDGRTVVVMDPMVSQVLDENTLDVEQTDDGAAFKIS